MRNIRSIRRADATALARKRDTVSDAVSSHRRLAHILVLVLPLLLPPGVLAGYARSSVPNPIGPATVPPSSYQSGVVRTPGAASDTGNLIVTGNVSGAKQFRAPVPYQSPTSFQGRLGSTSLDSFLRVSAAPPEAGRYSRGYGAFYSPTGTVAKIGAGQAADSVPLMQATAMNSATVVQPRVASATPVKDWRMWEQLGSRSVPLSSSQTWKALSPGPAPASADRHVSPLQRETVIPEDTFRQLESAQANRVASEPTLTTTGRVQGQTARDGIDISHTGGLFDNPGLVGGVSSSQPALPPSSSVPRYESTAVGNDVLARAAASSRPQALAVGSRDSGKAIADGRWEMSDWGLEAGDGGFGIAESEFAPSARFNQESEIRNRQSSTARKGGNGVRGTPYSSRSSGITWVGSSSDGPAPSRADASSAGRVSALLERLRATSGSRNIVPGATEENEKSKGENSAQPLLGDQILQKYKAPESFSANDYERHMQAARSYVQAGRYYRAAESFTLASGYQPSNALPHLGKSIALFAAGEYVSSSLSLGRALELNPQSALTQARIVNAAGGPGRFEQRLADLEQCLKESDAPQLMFLLAYVYHHSGRSQEAASAIKAAQKGLPSSVAVDILKAAIAP